MMRASAGMNYAQGPLGMQDSYHGVKVGRPYLYSPLRYLRNSSSAALSLKTVSLSSPATQISQQVRGNTTPVSLTTAHSLRRSILFSTSIFFAVLSTIYLLTFLILMA